MRRAPAGLILTLLVPAPAQAMIAQARPSAAGCSRPEAVQPIEFDAAKYPHIEDHTEGAISRGWPQVLVITRRNEEARRERRLADIPTKAGFDRDEYPPAIG